jgi:bifunctional enzyme CysN/CysC
MSHQSELIEKDILAYLAQHERKELLRFLTCGSVDDGKSTLIGRLLHDSKMIYEDQLASIHRDSQRQGSAGEEVDLALLMDGLKAEREQGITIDVAYRFFSTAKRKFIIADTPGHEQYTRNMVTGASTADLAIILIDAEAGMTQQSRRHSFIVSLLGIRHVVVAVNKMDLVDWSEDRFAEIKAEYNDFVARLDIADLHFIPISALKGDNVVESSSKMSWYRGAPLMDHLENVQISSDRNLVDFRLPVQWINRPDHTFRGVCGTVASGVVRPGDRVMVLPSKKTSRVQRIVTQGGDLERAFPPLAVTVVLEDEIDVSRGDMLVFPGNVPNVVEEFEAMVVWMAEEAMIEGREYVILQGAGRSVGVVERLRYRVDVNTLRRQDASRLDLNEIGRCKIGLARPIAIDAYKNNRVTGSFVIVDRMSNMTVGAGMILARRSVDDAMDGDDAVLSATSNRSPDSLVGLDARLEGHGHLPKTILLSGLPAAGKTSIALELEGLMVKQGRPVVLMDEESLRRDLTRDLGESTPARAEALRRASAMARLLNDSGVSCICAFTLPDDGAISRARNKVGAQRFMHAYVDTPIERCRAWDEAGNYRDAEGAESTIEASLAVAKGLSEGADLRLETSQSSAALAAELLARLDSA